MHKICMVETNNISYDSRVQNEALALSKNFEITVIARKFPNQGSLRQIPFRVKRINYRGFRLGLLNILSSFWSLSMACFKENPDVFHAHDIDGLLCAFLAALFKRKILIYDSHELWSDIYPFTNLRGVRWLLPLLEKVLMTKVAAGITVNQSIAKYLSGKYHRSFLAIYNTTDSKLQKAPINLRKSFPNQKLIIHSGGANEGRGFEEMILAAAILPKNYRLIFLGAGLAKSEIEENITALKLKKKIAFLPAVKPDEIVSVVSQADLGLALTQKISLSYYYSLPNKLFQYINGELPVLGSNFPEFKNIIVSNHIGQVVNPSEPGLIAKKIVEMIKPLNQKKYRQNLKKIKKNYRFEAETKKLVLFYENLFNNVMDDISRHTRYEKAK